MTIEERRRRAVLQMKGYPARIATANGYFLTATGCSVNWFKTLSEAVDHVLRYHERHTKCPAQ